MLRSTFFVLLLLASTFVLADSTSPSGEKHDRLADQFKKADKDHDGTLTKDEAKAMPLVYKNFDAMDTDKDGTVSMDEIRAYEKTHKKTAHERGKEQFMKADKDHDGTLTKEEAKAMPHVYQNFDAIDVDKDGTVSLEEIHNYMKAKREKKQSSSPQSN
ncbi:MAG TPA: EF-hand domain-containing protein [Burkholderiales bacterium]|nr:EF-hand domain-containing protein [Burkholderiales bacterium]